MTLYREDEMHDPLFNLVTRARQGDPAALEDVLRNIQDRLYTLSLRMLYHPADAEDATQEILVKIITHLGSFRGEGAFLSWAMKVAANHLLSIRRRPREKTISFEEMASKIVSDWPKPWKELESVPMQNLLVEEFRIACLQVILLGLDRAHRLAYILGEIFEVSGPDGAKVLGIGDAAYRKRLQRARSRIQHFMVNHCALIRPGNPCLCERQADFFLATGQLRADRLVFADHPCRLRHSPLAMTRLREMDELARISSLYQTHPDFKAPGSFVAHLRELVDSGRFEVLRQS
jgi:RNA polymerase sigma factor (sigma-70 family)